MVTTASVALFAVAANVDVQPWLDRSILLDIVLWCLAIGAGLALLLSGSRPSDVLHLVYAPILIGVIVVGRYLGRRPRGRYQAAWMVASMLLSFGVLARLAMTA